MICYLYALGQLQIVIPHELSPNFLGITRVMRDICSCGDWNHYCNWKLIVRSNHRCMVQNLFPHSFIKAILLLDTLNNLYSLGYIEELDP